MHPEFDHPHKQKVANRPIREWHHQLREERDLLDGTQGYRDERLQHPTTIPCSHLCTMNDFT